MRGKSRIRGWIAFVPLLIVLLRSRHIHAVSRHIIGKSRHIGPQPGHISVDLAIKASNVGI
jgi:hypothetical protein